MHTPVSLSSRPRYTTFWAHPSSLHSQNYLGLEGKLFSHPRKVFPGFLCSSPEGGWISLSINIIPSSGLCIIFYTCWRVKVNVLQLFGNQGGLNYMGLTCWVLRMCGFWKVEMISTNTFMEITVNSSVWTSLYLVSTTQTFPCQTFLSLKKWVIPIGNHIGSVGKGMGSGVSQAWPRNANVPLAPCQVLQASVS